MQENAICSSSENVYNFCLNERNRIEAYHILVAHLVKSSWTGGGGQIRRFEILQYYRIHT